MKPVVKERIAAVAPRLKARLAGVFYLLTFLTGTYALVFVSGRPVALLLASCCYFAVTLLFWRIRVSFTNAYEKLAVPPRGEAYSLRT
jgi:hypothetical protein